MAGSGVTGENTQGKFKSAAQAAAGTARGVTNTPTFLSLNLFDKIVVAHARLSRETAKSSPERP